MNSAELSRYLKSLLIIVIIVAFQTYLANIFNESFLSLLYPAVFLIAWRWGMGPALATIIVSIAASIYYNIAPVMEWKVLHGADMVRLVTYGVMSSAMSWIIVSGENWKRQSHGAIQELSSVKGRFDRSAESINLGIWYCDIPFDEFIWDRNTKEHFWLPPNARVTVDTFYERIHPDDREMTRKAIDYSIANKAPYDIEYRTTNPNDPTQVKHIRAIGWTDYNDKGEPVRFDGITIDNSALKHTRSELNETIEVVETINKVGTFLSAELDQKKLVQQVTDAATQLSHAEFGAFFYNLINEEGQSYTLYTVSGVPIENFTKFPMPRMTAVFGPTFNGDGIVRSDDITKDPRYGKNEPYHGMPKGHLPVVSYLAVPVISRSGEVIGGLFLGHKKTGVFTEREERIVSGLASQIAIAMDNSRLFEKAKEAVRIRDEFLSISSHELKTPLTSLKMQLQMLSNVVSGRHQMTPENVKKFVAISERQVNRLNALVEDLLDVTRISNGKLPLKLEEVDLSELIREIEERYRPLVSQSKCTIEVHALPKLRIKADRMRFEQVLVNLVTNSMKYAPGSHININLEEEGGDAVISVTDNGPGIRPEDQERIFKRFERVHTRSGQAGLGLGLYIVHQIVQAHDGTISLRSDKETGAEFTIRVPVTT